MPKLANRPHHRARQAPDTASPPSPKGTEGTAAPGGALITTERASACLVPSTSDEATEQRSPSDWALLQAGLVILPAKPKQKAPYVPWKKYQDTRPTEDEYRKWFGKPEPRNYWLACGGISQVCVLDTDTAEADRFWREDAGLAEAMDATVRVKTTKGYHYYFWVSAEDITKGWAYHHDDLGFDVRGQGGGVVLPPSTHPSGARYEWVTAPDLNAEHLGMVPRPGCLVSEEALRAHLASLGKELPRQAKAPGNGVAEAKPSLAELLADPPAEGGRNVWFTKVCGHLAANYRGDHDRYLAEARAANATCRPPQEEKSWMKTAENIWKSDQENHPGEPARGSGEGKPDSAATQLVQMALESYEFGVDEDGEVFARPPQSHVVRALSGDKRGLRAELSRTFFRRNGKVASQQALSDAFSVLEGEAQESDPVPVATRVAEADGAIWIDLGDVDERVIRVADGRWGITDQAPVLFRRTRLTGVFPTPERGGDLEGLWNHLNVSQEDRPLVLAWMAQALLQPNQPHPVLTVFGEQGTAKSTLTKRLISLIDPSPVPLRKPPRDAETWSTTAAGAYVVGLDNLSSIPDWLSDSLCRAATGENDVRGTKYKDKDLTLFRVLCPLVVNGIDLGALRGDLADRAVRVQLDQISERKTDKELAAEWDPDYPALVGAVLDLVAKVQTILPTVTVTDPVRMADYHHVLVATDLALDTSGDQRLRSLAGSMAEGVIQAQPFTAAILAYGQPLSGSASAILAEMDATRTERYGAKGWPNTPSYVTSLLRRSAPAFREIGWEVTEQEDRHAKVTRWYLTPPGAATQQQLA